MNFKHFIIGIVRYSWNIVNNFSASNFKSSEKKEITHSIHYWDIRMGNEMLTLANLKELLK